MNAKRIGRGLMAALLLVQLSAVPALAAEGAAGAPEQGTSDTGCLPRLNTWDHNKFMDGSSDGLFGPNRSMTRAETAQVLYSLLEEKPYTAPDFTDVDSDAWYATAIGTLEGLGVLTGDEDGNFRPNEAITRADFAVMLCHFIPESQEQAAFTDVPVGHPAYTAVSTAAAYGLFSGYGDGSFHPDGALTRAEAATVFNKLLGRVPDEARISGGEEIRFFPDLSDTHWAYGQIMEATVSHGYIRLPEGGEQWTDVTFERTALPDGFHNIGGWLYRVENGRFLRSETRDMFTFDENGRYTTGFPQLDQQLTDLVGGLTSGSMSQEQKLRVLYNYCRDEFTYLKRPLVEKGQTGWEFAYAEEFLRLGKGNCYSFSALFCLLARELGYSAYPVVGGLGESDSPHGWVEIPMDGEIYMFDPQLEWRYLHNYGKEGYDLFKMSRDDTPFVYVR